jgi:tetratricopeptide (TPR) repeat protein
VNTCAALVVVMSPSSEGSRWVRLEVGRALFQGRPVHPILLAGRRFDWLNHIQDEPVAAGQILPSTRFVSLLQAAIATPAPLRPPVEATQIVPRRTFPLRNPNFVGRADLLLDLETGLYWGKSSAPRSGTATTVAVQTLHGTGGVGKTQLAAEYAHRRASDYDFIAWIDAEKPALLAGQLAELAPLLNVSEAEDASATAEGVVVALGLTRLRWLLVFDNAEDASDLAGWLPRTGTGQVIITSRRTGWSHLGATIEVEVFKTDEALTLLRERASGVDEQSAAEIVTLLGHLPLAIEQAAGHLRSAGRGADDYLRLLRDRGEELLATGRLTGYEHTLATLWDVSRASLRAANPAADQLLQLCAFLGPEPIPLHLFTDHPDLLPAELADVARDELRFDRAVAELRARSLARRDVDGTAVTVHRLLATAIRAAMPDSERRTTVAVLEELLYSHLPEEIVDSPQSWPVWRSLLPHVLAATSHPSTHRTDGDRTAWLLDRTGTYLQTRGEPAAARPLLERALAIDEIKLGASHSAVATRLNSLAVVLKDLGEPAIARPLLERALAIDETNFDPNHPRVATRLSNLAAVLQDLDETAAARPLLERALAIEEINFGPNHPAVATLLSNLAAVLQDLSDPLSARPLLERALAIDETNFGPNHPAVARDLNNLALVLVALHRPDDARRMLDRAVRVVEAVHGDEHPTTVTMRDNLRSLGD